MVSFYDLDFVIFFDKPRRILSKNASLNQKIASIKIRKNLIYKVLNII